VGVLTRSHAAQSQDSADPPESTRVPPALTVQQEGWLNPERITQYKLRSVKSALTPT